MKILLSAYSCAPCKTSEPGNAWRSVNHALAEGHEVWALIEKSEYEPGMMSYLAENPMPRFHPVFFQLPHWMVRALRRPGMLGCVYYHLWQHKMLGIAQKLHDEIGFDLVHHVTFGRYWSPCGIRDLGIPFIWGPVGAAEYAPSAFLAELPIRERWFEFVRDFIRAVSQRDPALRATARAATIGIGVSREACEAIRDLGVRRVEQLPQAALAADELETFGKFPSPPPGPFRAICMGRLLHWKGFHLAIRAFGLFAKNDPEAELWLINNGPFRPNLEEIAARTGVADRIRFFGHLPSYADVLAKLAQAHVLMHPALHEAFGNVCMEAMAAGRPVVCLDIGGPASQVTAETGFVAPIHDPQEAIEAMAGFLTRVSRDRALLAKLSEQARARVHEKFTMRTMGAAISRFYEEAVAAHPAPTRRAAFAY
ncbi:MAG: glycosyltransferase family 4 protein [Methylacidiphilales bacterium]|nr:glycosyltransferase family 4 protein [Candidatus Methylacidiphilales bacterium]